MEVSSSKGLTYDMEEEAFKGLVDAFGSVFSLQEIASAYCNAGRNVDLAGEFLYDKQTSTLTSSTNSSDGEAKGKELLETSYDNISQNQCLANGKFQAGRNVDLAGEFLYDKRTSTLTSSTNSSDGEAKGKELLETSYDNISQNQCLANGKFRAAKKKCRPFSGGSVSSVIGKDYFRPTQAANGSCESTKPLKLDSKEFTTSEIWGEEAQPKPSNDDHLHKDMEDFRYKMLGEGFQMNRDVIQEVLENCGFDMQRSLRKLLDQSAETSDGRATCCGKSTEKFMETSSNPEGLSCQRKSQQLNSGGDSNINGGELPRQLKDRNELQKEVWAALFTTPDIYEESLKGTVKTVRRSKAFGEVVTGPPMEFIEHKPILLDIQIDDDKIADEDENSNYQVFRRAVVEYRAAMKECYNAALDAFTKGDHIQASKVLEQGHFFHAKARELDEESNQIIFETRNVVASDDVDTGDDMVLDLHEHDAKDTIRLLKSHLLSLSGIPSMKYLKVILEKNDEDTSHGARRRLVMKLLDKESIEWIEGKDRGTILICWDKINPKQLSFLKKK